MNEDFSNNIYCNKMLVINENKRNKTDQEYYNDLLESIKTMYMTDNFVRTIIDFYMSEYRDEYMKDDCRNYYEYGFIQYMLEHRRNEFVVNLLIGLKNKSDELYEQLIHEKMTSTRPIVMQYTK